MLKVTTETNCLTCDYSLEQPIGEDLQTRSSCILNPPTMCAIGAAQGMAHVTAFPQVTAGMICAKWEKEYIPI